MDRQARERADDRAVDADELQVLAHEQLEGARGLLAVPAGDRLLDHPGERRAVGAQRIRRGAAGVAVHAVAQLGVLLQAGAEVAQGGHERAMQVGGRVLERVQERVPQGDPGPPGPRAQPFVREKVPLEPFHRGAGGRLVPHLVGEAVEPVVDGAAGLVLPVAADAGEILEGLGVQSLGEEAVHEVRAPLGGATAHRLDEQLGVGGHPVPGVGDHEVHHALVVPAGHHVLQHARERGGPVRGHHVAFHQLAQQLLDGVVVGRGHGAPGRRRDLPGGAGRVLLTAQPAAGGLGHLQSVDLLVGDLRVQEVLLHELGQRGAELVLLPRDQGGVRHGHPHRVAEQRRDREPVRQRADHAALRGGAHVAPHRVGVLQRERDHEHHGQQDEQPQGDGLHAPQARRAFEGAGAEQLLGGVGGEGHGRLLIACTEWSPPVNQPGTLR